MGTGFSQAKKFRRYLVVDNTVNAPGAPELYALKWFIW